MIDPVKENFALVEHFFSFVCTIVTIYFNNNSNVQFLALMSMIQHFVKIIRIYFFGFELKGSPVWFCNLHAFINHFSNNILVIITCFIILHLYVAIKYPDHYIKYNKRMRPYVFLSSILYTASFTLAAFFKPIFIGYSAEEIASRTNCSTAYRDRFYQFILGSSVTHIEFIFISIYCTIYIIYKIIITPTVKMKKHLSASTKMSLSKWIVILFICFSITLISLLNIKDDIIIGLEVEKGMLEKDYIETTYFITASNGILIMIFFLSPKQVKYKLGMNVVERSNHFYEYNISTNSYIYTPKNNNGCNRNSREINIVNRDDSIDNTKRYSYYDETIAIPYNAYLSPYSKKQIKNQNNNNNNSNNNNVHIIINENSLGHDENDMDITSCNYSKSMSMSSNDGSVHNTLSNIHNDSILNNSINGDIHDNSSNTQELIHNNSSNSNKTTNNGSSPLYKEIDITNSNIANNTNNDENNSYNPNQCHTNIDTQNTNSNNEYGIMQNNDYLNNTDSELQSIDDILNEMNQYNQKHLKIYKKK